MSQDTMAYGKDIGLQDGITQLLAELAGMSARAIANELNKRKIETPTGAPWSAKTVIRARERLAVS